MTELCLNGPRCIDHVDGHPREVGAEQSFCERCLERTAELVLGLPAAYCGLHTIIGSKHTGVDTGIRTATPGSTVPLNLAVDTLMGRIEYTLALAGEIIADVLHLECDCADAEAIAEHIPLLADIGKPPAEPIDILCWARSGTWRYISTTTGPRIIVDLNWLALMAQFHLGQTRARITRDLPCARCHAKTVGRWAGSDEYDCQTCGSRFLWSDIERQDRILVELYRQGKLHT